jgi:hypothetical protein
MQSAIHLEPSATVAPGTLQMLPFASDQNASRGRAGRVGRALTGQGGAAGKEEQTCNYDVWCTIMLG